PQQLGRSPPRPAGTGPGSAAPACPRLPGGGPRRPAPPSPSNASGPRAYRGWGPRGPAYPVSPQRDVVPRCGAGRGQPGLALRASRLPTRGCRFRVSRRDHERISLARPLLLEADMDDIAKLMLRILIGGLLLFHGVDKLRNGVGSVRADLAKAGLPGILAYGIYLGEVVAPLLVLLGLWTRPMAVIAGG